MKKPKIPILILTTCLFVGFLLGFFAGRNLNRTPVQIRTVSPSTAATEAVPTESDVSSESTDNTSPATDNYPVNINTATSAQLETLPGIGPVFAQRIIDYRNANGPFSSPGQLLNVTGIGEKRLEAIWDYITIGE